MNRITEEKIGDKVALRFKSEEGTIGTVGFDNKGFKFDKQVGQDKLIVLPYSTSVFIDGRLGNIFELTLEGNTTIDLINPSVGYYTIKIIQDSIGSHSVTLQSDWYVESDSGLPDFSSDMANTINMIGLFYDGANIFVGSNSNFVQISTL